MTATAEHQHQYQYVPRGAARRAMDFLETIEPGKTVASRTLAEAIGVHPEALTDYLTAAVRRGFITKLKTPGGRDCYWCLPREGVKPVIDAPAQPREKKPRTEAQARADDEASMRMRQIITKAVPLMKHERPTGPSSVFDMGRMCEDDTRQADAATPVPEGLAGAARRPSKAKETAQRGAGSADIAQTRETATGAGDDAKRDGWPASPEGPRADMEIPQFLPRGTVVMRPAVAASVAVEKPEVLHALREGVPRCALWSDGTLHMRWACGFAIELDRDETRALVQYLDAIALDEVRG